MIRFRIVGSGYVELPADFDFTFNYNNGIFAFDKMQLSRSGEFTIPRTPANDLLLGFSHDPSNDGNYIRKSKPAELHYSGGKIDGYLFIGKYTTGSGYSAVFVYGELAGLKRIQELGTIDEYVSTNDQTDFDESLINSYFPTGLLPFDFRFLRYQNGIPDANKNTTYVNQLPMVKLSYLLSQAATAAGVNLDPSGIGQAIDAVGLILATNNAEPTLQSVSVTGAANLSLAISGTGAGNFNMETRQFVYWDYTAPTAPFRKVNVRVLVCKYDLTILPAVNSYNTAIITGDGTTYLTSGSTSNFKDMRIGQKIELKKDDYFTFVNLSDTRLGIPIDDYDTPIPAGISFRTYIGELDLVDVGDSYYLQQNLPKVTLLDLVKTFANLFRVGVTYDAATNKIGFFDFDFNKANYKKLDDTVVEIKSVSRSFLDYAKNNYIKFKNEDYVTESKAQTIYTINNDTLADEKILYTIPFSEGIKNELNEVVLNDFELVAPYKKTAKIGTLAVPSIVSGENHLKHISMLYQYLDTILQWSDNLTPIIQNSTTVEMSVKMIAGDFLKIKNTDVFGYRGKKFVCIAGSHSGEIADLTLVKI